MRYGCVYAHVARQQLLIKDHVVLLQFLATVDTAAASKTEHESRDKASKAC
jgi:hypothetical protein